ncbi:MAG: hypothetical protein J6W47_05395 [Bacteroidales bacterium]|nr:hypothetical protein [Clostridiales bacterium]MBP5764525.1 hypothetical protein [Bacteroidales bacterium]
MKKIKSKWKDIAVRALKTFLQAFLASITFDATTLGDPKVFRSILISALAAGLSAVMNSAIAALSDDFY